MARPCKSVNVMSKHLTDAEKLARTQAEESLRGGTDRIKPPTYLNSNAKKIFKYIVKELQSSGILTNLDVYVLASCSIAIDRIQESEKMLNEDILNKDALRIKESYMKEFFRLCSELSLSPQSRAKLANINVQTKQDAADPLLKILGGEA
jgi:P27 family predicted phage terminase small subunit